MIKLVYNPNSVTDAKNNFKIYMENINEALSRINTEFQDIDKVLNTPKANPEIMKYKEDFNDALTYINESKDSFDETFDLINREYQDHIEYVRKMVGSDYEAE